MPKTPVTTEISEALSPLIEDTCACSTTAKPSKLTSVATDVGASVAAAVIVAGIQIAIATWTQKRQAKKFADSASA